MSYNIPFTDVLKRDINLAMNEAISEWSDFASLGWSEYFNIPEENLSGFIAKREHVEKIKDTDLAIIWESLANAFINRISDKWKKFRENLSEQISNPSPPPSQNLLKTKKLKSSDLLSPDLRLLNNLGTYNNSFVILDLETTGLDIETDRIVSVSMIEIENKPDPNIKSYDSLVKPHQTDWIENADSVKIHGLTKKILSKAPLFRQIALEISDVLKRAIVIGHNIAKFDLPILFNEFERIGYAKPRLVECWDTITMSYPKKNLDTVYELFTGLSSPRRGNQYHTANLDALMVGRILIPAIKKYNIYRDRTKRYDLSTEGICINHHGLKQPLSDINLSRHRPYKKQRLGEQH